MKVKAYVSDEIKMYWIEGLKKFGIKFPCVLFDTYTEEESRLLLKKFKNSRGIFIINWEEKVENEINDSKKQIKDLKENCNIDYKRECEVLALQLHLLREEAKTTEKDYNMLKEYYKEQNEVNTKFISKSKIEELVKQLEQDDINITKKYKEGKGLKRYLSDIDRVRIRAYRTKTREIKERIQKILEGD